MKVLALNKLPDHSYADCSIYKHDPTKDEFENAFLLSNITTFTVIYIDYDAKTLKILNQSGIASVICDDNLFKVLIAAQFTYDYRRDQIFLHDYSYYIDNEIRTEQWWAYLALKDHLINWKIRYVGPAGIHTRHDYSISRFVQNTATDDDIISEYIYNEGNVAFDIFLRDKIIDRVTTALHYDRLSNRVFRMYLPPMYQINIGPRNESMFTYLHSNCKHYAANVITWKEIISKPQSKYSERINADFDVGQYKNMCNFLATYYRFIYVYGKFPIKCYILGSAPGYWIKDLQDRGMSTPIETWDSLDTPYSQLHHKELFFIKDVSKLQNNSILYIDIRTDRGSMTWQKWRERVEFETEQNLAIAMAYLEKNPESVVCVKMTAMNIKLPISTKLLHFPTTRRRSEWYALLEHHDLNVKKVYFPKGTLYSYINNTQTQNVFISEAYKVRAKTSKGKRISALYALSNSSNVKSDVIEFINNATFGIFTVRLNNTFDNVQQISFKNDMDNLFLPSDFPSLPNTIITSYKGAAAVMGLSTTNDIKPTGNNHIFILKGIDSDNLDEYATHMGISRHSHKIRFSEAATALSGYIYRDLISDRPILNFAQKDNAVSGHLYNALIYYRYNYTFDLMRWLRQHLDDEVRIKGGKYQQHTDEQVLNSCRAAKQYMKRQNDLTGQSYVDEIIQKFDLNKTVMYADSPTHYIAVCIDGSCNDHVTVALLETDERFYSDIVKILAKFSKSILIHTENEITLGETRVVLVDGIFEMHDQLYLELQRKQIPSAQRRPYVPHLTTDDPVAHQRKNYWTREIYLKKIKGDVIHRQRMIRV
nr:VP3 [Rotavirus A]